MKITSTQYAKSLYETTVGKTQPEIDGMVANFLKVLQKNRRMKLAPKIMTKFAEIWNKENSIIEAEITSREVLSGEVRTKVRTYLRTKYQAKEVVLNNKIDSNIKGGIIIKVGDEILDGSVARQVQELKEKLEK